jgi:hypothetical protein
MAETLNRLECAARFPSPLGGGARGGGSHNRYCSAIPPSLSLPHEGGGNAGVRVEIYAKVHTP